MTTPYLVHYRHLIGRIPDQDLYLLREAEWQQWEDIDPEKAQSPEAAAALKNIAREKALREEAYI